MNVPNLIPLTETFIRSLILPRPADGHKGTFGHALITAGKKGTIGAAILAARAALRTGCGLLTVHSAGDAAIPLLAQLPEAMFIPRKKKKLPELTKYSAVGFGPGVGVDDAGGRLLLQLLEGYRRPLVIDADGLTLLAQHRDWYHLLTPQMILTPHPGEFDRLTQIHASTEARIERQRELAAKHQVTVILKGRGTTIALPDGSIYQNTTGNSGMATAGSGDVLTGIIASLCAQGYSPQHTALIGVYLHGFAGDIAAEKLSKTSLRAGDIVDGVPCFFRAFERES